MARIEVSGKSYYGQNARLSKGSLSIEKRRDWFNLLKKKGKLKELNDLSDAQFLSHAEAQALIKARGKLPKKVESRYGG